MPELGASWELALWGAFVIPVIGLILYWPAIRKLRSGRYEVVHIHWLSQGIVGLLIARPFFAQSHGSDLHVNLGNPVLRGDRLLLDKEDCL